MYLRLLSKVWNKDNHDQQDAENVNTSQDDTDAINTVKVRHQTRNRRRLFFHAKTQSRNLRRNYAIVALFAAPWRECKVDRERARSYVSTGGGRPGPAAKFIAKAERREWRLRACIAADRASQGPPSPTTSANVFTGRPPALRQRPRRPPEAPRPCRGPGAARPTEKTSTGRRPDRSGAPPTSEEPTR
ncbi:hypothetical protein NQ318_014187 [Aromia moschata]|uniref:Uncharacterized protein n=1 Tax=Aromia moschata TaxID=1265417 RepID=A0AAV8Y8W9_9CUCU|nr:hypothetical protein NQ318_014187 [Aromia moschata]